MTQDGRLWAHKVVRWNGEDLEITDDSPARAGRVGQGLLVVDPASLLDSAVRVGSDGLIREIAVSWGTWTYTVTYSDLGSTPPLVAPPNAKSTRELRQLPPQR